MPKPPVTISIAPSRLALAAHLSLALAVSGMLMWVGPLWLGVAALLGLVAITAHWWHRQQPWSLRHAVAEGGSWQIAERGSVEEWRTVRLGLVYLGPWLIGLRLAGRQVWLWPDSAAPDARRELRHRLLAERAAGTLTG
ncbi:hypothetical protein IEI94_04320 [Halomonas sp. ML-15]|uniref:hypothetical protein n=1 Tax=Halomonas sp. ML-15 TaxID=2773305 RepID=UPI001747C89B|nr:hypothetical protein [Halomonas sp. ML-15]MBD3895078.1 hypothetical protein [Halomonas sp. ML-15]